MRLAAVFLALLPLGAQEVVSLPVGTPRPGASTLREVGAVDPELHANVLQLIELTGDRQRLRAILPKLVSDGKAKMLQAFPNVDPAFADEWERRMAERLHPDDFLDAVAGVYEKHFTNDEILSLIALLSSRKEGKPARASAELQNRLTAETPAMMGEIAGSATELAVQVGDEIEKEHPEYLRRKAAATPR